MIAATIINGTIVLSSDGNDLLTMKQMSLSDHKELMLNGLDFFREETAAEVKKRFDEVEPHFATEEDRADALNLVEAKYREVPGTTGVHKDTGERHN